MELSRSRPSVLRNTGEVTVAVLVDQETFLVPPSGCLQTTGRGEVYLAFAGDAPMVAIPIENAESRPLVG